MKKCFVMMCVMAAMTNASPKMQAEANALMKEISTRLQKAQDQELQAEMQRDAKKNQDK